MDGQQENICGYATIENTCQEHKIDEIGVLDFQVKIIDQLGNLYKSMSEPKIEVDLFNIPESAQLGVAIIPTAISELTATKDQNHLLTFRLELVSSKTVKVQAYGEILNLVKITINFLEVLQNRHGLTYSTNLGILNSSASNLTVTIRKRI